jgi:hypothetical protein
MARPAELFTQSGVDHCTPGSVNRSIASYWRSSIPAHRPSLSHGLVSRIDHRRARAFKGDQNEANRWQVALPHRFSLKFRILRISVRFAKRASRTFYWGHQTPTMTFLSAVILELQQKAK